jgi:signal transduction histidine kinase
LEGWDRGASERELRILAQLGGVLASSDYDDAFAELAKLAVTEIADFFVVFLVGEGDMLQRVRSASRNESLGWCAEWMMQVRQDERHPEHPVWRVLAERQPVLLTLTPDVYERLAQSTQHLAALRAARPISSLTVPLLIGDRCVGVLGFSTTAQPLGQRDARLAEEIARRCALFVDNIRLQRMQRDALRARDELLGIVAHDLRGPVSSVRLQAHLVISGNSAAEMRTHGETILRITDRMIRLIDDLVDLSHLEAGRLAMRPARVQLQPLLDEVLAGWATRAASKQLELELATESDLPELMIDSTKMRHVFDNLIDNALEVTASGKITIGACRDGSSVRLWVADTGPGIAREDLSRAFERFWRGPSSRHKGVGIGLSIVHAIVVAHGGRAWIESEPGEGTRVSFTLPQ